MNSLKAPRRHARIIVLIALVTVAGALALAGLSTSARANALRGDADACATITLYADCADATGSCYNNALHLSGSSMHVDGAIHSNSGLHVSGSSWTQSLQIAVWGTFGLCSDPNVLGLCAPGYAQQQAPRTMPEVYSWDDFQPGGYWWNDMCQGAYADRCHIVNDDIGPNDVVSSGLWVVNGGIHSPRFYNLAQSRYTFVTSGDVSFDGDMPLWEPYVGSSATGGASLFIYSTAHDPAGARLSAGRLNWKGMIYAPKGLVSLSGVQSVTARGGVYAWRVKVTGGDINLTQDVYVCPPPDATSTVWPVPTAGP